MTRHTYRTSEGIERAVKKGIKIIRVEDMLYSAMANLAAYSNDCVETFTVKPVFLDKEGLVFDVSVGKLVPWSHTQQTEPINVEREAEAPRDYFAEALRLFPNYISFGCGHRIEATISDIEGLDDGVDLSFCPTCKRTQEN